jgi:hypothetical protein
MRDATEAAQDTVDSLSLMAQADKGDLLIVPPHFVPGELMMKCSPTCSVM